MKWTDIVTAVATAAAAIGTVGALVFLTIQVRAQAAQVREQERDRREDADKSRKAELKRLTLSLYEQFHSKEMFDARVTAYRILKGPGVDRPIPYDGIELRTDINSQALSQILHFFGKIVVLADSEMIDTNLFCKLMNPNLELWLTNYLAKDNLREEGWWSETKRSLETLLKENLSYSSGTRAAQEWSPGSRDDCAWRAN